MKRKHIALQAIAIASSIAESPYSNMAFDKGSGANGMYIPKRSTVIKNKRRKKRR
ncbi:MAG: hypothetical protein ACI3XA_06760 [Clostridia bacterium]